MRVYVAIPVPRTNERFKPSKMIRRGSRAKAEGAAAISEEGLLFARDSPCPGNSSKANPYCICGPTCSRGRTLRRSVIFVDSTGPIVKSDRALYLRSDPDRDAAM